MATCAAESKKDVAKSKILGPVLSRKWSLKRIHTLWASLVAQRQKIHLQCRSRLRHGFDPWRGKIPWRRAWEPTPVFLPGESHGQRSLAGYSPWGHRESDVTEQLSTHVHVMRRGMRGMRGRYPAPRKRMFWPPVCVGKDTKEGNTHISSRATQSNPSSLVSSREGSEG